jgi:hypothetical protein
MIIPYRTQELTSISKLSSMRMLFYCRVSILMIAPVARWGNEQSIYILNLDSSAHLLLGVFGVKVTPRLTKHGSRSKLSEIIVGHSIKSKFPCELPAER